MGSQKAQPGRLVKTEALVSMPWFERNGSSCIFARVSGSLLPRGPHPGWMPPRPLRVLPLRPASASSVGAFCSRGKRRVTVLSLSWLREASFSSPGFQGMEESGERLDQLLVRRNAPRGFLRACYMSLNEVKQKEKRNCCHRRRFQWCFKHSFPRIDVLHLAVRESWSEGDY